MRITVNFLTYWFYVKLTRCHIFSTIRSLTKHNPWCLLPLKSHYKFLAPPSFKSLLVPWTSNFIVWLSAINCGRQKSFYTIHDLLPIGLSNKFQIVKCLQIHIWLINWLKHICLWQISKYLELRVVFGEIKWYFKILFSDLSIWVNRQNSLFWK